VERRTQRGTPLTLPRVAERGIVAGGGPLEMSKHPSLALLAQALSIVTAFVVIPAAQTSSKPIPAPPDVAAPPSDAAKTASGLATKVLTPGTGKDHPTKDDLVTVHYTGWKTDGTMFDSSVSRGKPSVFPVGRVIPGFSEGLQ